MLKKALKSLIPALLLAGGLHAQNYMSPFSMHGLGDIQPNTLVRYKGMGGISIAGMDKNMYSLSNPATYSNVRSFVLETGLTGNFYEIYNGNQKLKTADYKIPYLSFAIPLDTTHKFGLSAGLMPFSKTGYQIKVLGTSPLNTMETYEVQGQLSKFYVGASGMLFRNFYIGANAGYLFGNSDMYHTLSFPDSTDLSVVRERTVTNMGDFVFDWGAVFNDSIGKTHLLQIGVSGNVPKNIKTRQSTDLLSGSSIYTDSVYSTASELSDTRLPLMAGAAIKLSYLDSWQIGAEVRYNGWGNFSSYNIKQGTYANTWGIAIGGEWVPGSGPVAGKFVSYLGKIRYRIGASYMGVSSLKLWEQPMDRKLTLGLGLPVSMIKNRPSDFSFLDFAVELGQLGTLEQNSIYQRYIVFSLGVHVFESGWFARPKID